MKGALMRLPPRSLRHVMTHRWAFSAVALTVLITSAFTAAAAASLGTVTLIAVRSELIRNPGSQIVVAAPVAGNGVAPATSVVAAAVRGPLGPGAPPPLKAKLAVSLQSGIMKLVGRGRARHEAGDPADIAARTSLAQRRGQRALRTGCGRADLGLPAADGGSRTRPRHRRSGHPEGHRVWRDRQGADHRGVQAAAARQPLLDAQPDGPGAGPS